MSSPHQLTLLIVTRDRKQDLLANLEHAGRYRHLFLEALIVDNASADGGPEEAQARYDWVRVLRLETNQGIMIPRNLGIREARGDLVFSLDDDGRFDFGALPLMLREFDVDPRVAVVGGKVINLPDADVFNLAFEPHRPSEPRMYQSFRFRGGNAIMRKTAMLEIGGLPERFFYGSEERDIAYRLFKHGYRVLIYEGGILLHRKSVSQGSVARFYSFHHRNRLWMIWRNLPWPAAVKETGYTLCAGFISSLATGHLRGFLRGLGQAASAMPDVIRRERNPLSRRQYREFTRLCRKELDPRRRFAGMARNVRMQKGLQA